MDRPTVAARVLVVLLTLVFVTFGTSSYANNTFPGTTITGSSGNITATTVGSNGEGGEPIPPASTTTNSMWYSWTAPASGVFTFGTCNTTANTTTNYDSSIAAYTGGAVNALTLIGGVDDTTGCASTAGANLGSVVAFTATSGTTYRLQIDGYQALTGAFQLKYGLVGFVFATPDASATEGGDTGAFTVALTTVPTAPVTVTIGTSAQCTFAATTLTFTLANWNVPQTVTATATNDAIVEGVHSCTPASITAAGGNFDTATGTPPVITVNDNDTATVTIANTTNGAEPATNGLMTVTQTAVSATNTVIAYSVGGTATSGSDYTALSGTVTILAGATTATIPIPVLDDTIVEPGETVVVTLTSVTSGLATLGATLIATNTISSNDSATVSIANTTNAAEPAANGVMTVTQTAISATNTVLSYTVSGTATSGTDYTALSGTVTVLAGATTATISIPVLDDAIVESGETVIVTLSAVTSGLATLGAPLAATNTFADNDAATLSIANTTNGAEAGPVNGLMTVTQTAVSATNTVLAYSVGGTATSGTDYTALSGTVTILAGATTATIPIPVLDDAILEGGETVIVTLTTVSSGLATLGAPLVATNTIADNDAATVTIANSTNAAEPATNGLMTLTQTALSSQNTVISYTVSGTATSGADYTALSGTVTILAGATTATINIPVLDDAIVEGGETVTVTLTTVTSGLATLGATLIATNTIADNDAASVSIANTTNGSEPATNGVMTVTQTAVSSQNTVISYTVSGTATSGADYTALSGTVTLLAGATTATIPIPLLDDLIVDPGETVIVTLSSVTSGLATLGATLIATNTIADNDTASFTIVKAVNAANITSPVTLTYTITIDNTGNVPLTGLTITDALLQGAAPRTLTSGPSYQSGDTDLDGQIDDVETWIYSATYAITQSNIDNGAAFSNTATFDTAETTSQVSNAAVTTVTQTPAITLDKTSDAVGPLIVGQTVNYTYLVVNTGNITVSGVNVNETAFNGFGTPVPSPLPTGPTTLLPGQSVTFTASYLVTQDDIDQLQ